MPSGVVLLVKAGSRVAKTEVLEVSVQVVDGELMAP